MLQMLATLAFWTMGIHHAHVLDTRGDDVMVFYIQSGVDMPRTGNCGGNLGKSLIILYPVLPSYLATELPSYVATRQASPEQT